MFIYILGEDIRKEWKQIKTTYINNFRNNDGAPTYFRMADLTFLNKFIRLSDEEQVRFDRRQQREFDLKHAVLQDDDVWEFSFGR